MLRETYQILKASCTIFLTLILSTNYSIGQKLDQIGKDAPIKVTGGLSLNQTAYSAWGMEDRRDPYRYVLSGNLNFDVYGMSIPLSLSYSNQNFNYTQPFNQFSLTPSYKWLNSQIGYGNVSYSPYTLGGHTFFGVELSGSPSDRWDFGVMYGRLKKASIYDPDAPHSEASFRRMGFALKSEYRHKGGNIGFTLFRAKDDPSSYSADSIPEGLLPQENIATSIYAGQTLLENLTVQAEVGMSFLSSNTFSEAKGDRVNGMDWLFTERTSTSAYWAFNGGFTYNLLGWNLGASYERIGPEYRTLGSYYANNDLETGSVNISGQLFQSKVSVSANVGMQRDNLNGDNASDMSNFNLATNIAWVISKRVNANASYSNFRSFTVIRNQFEIINDSDPLMPLDTLNYTQLTDAGNLGLNWVVSQSKTVGQNISLNLNYQQTSNEQSDTTSVSPNSTFWNGALSWNWSNRPSNFRIGLSANASLNQTNSEAGNTSTIGPTISCSKGLFEKKLKLRSSISFNQSRANDEVQSMVYSWRLGASTTFNEVHSLNLSSVLLNREDVRNDKPPITELTVTLGYSYRFKGFKKRDKQN
ncbi:TonB-dependent receptor [Flammeovirga aprica]|uniref:Outer membrane protein beta-barrel domain-containing protein n=1 Tax=Flammeovirga aprica JL-4 TaxID=694437 RepID=A0A7X9RUW7_9BACT|nr:hypothetical protein [Flammeovirga aprica]NME69084.1 hypothetical protein [Flammeovirga aprica JL-4]